MRLPTLLLLLLCLAATLRAQEPASGSKPNRNAVVPGPEAQLKVDLAGARDTVRIVRLQDGSLAYLVSKLGSEGDRILSPNEFATLYYTQQTETRGWLAGMLVGIFNTTSPVGIAWVSVGLAGQIIFMGRMLVQWFTSEKEKRSVIPVSFWWMSLIGSTMLLVYFVWRRDIVGILGNATGWIVYVRNLILIHRAGS